MVLNSIKYQNYVEILKEELIPAMGCTEPIALAYCGAKAREILGCLPESVLVKASGSIIKNVKSVIVPHTNHLKGIPAAVSAGIIAGNASKELEVIAHVESLKIEEIKTFLQSVNIEVEHIDDGHVFDMWVILKHGEEVVKVRIVDHHTNIVYIEKNGLVLLEKLDEIKKTEQRVDRTCLNIKDIYEFATNCNLDDVREVISRQIKMNTAIAKAGLEENYGANIGKTLLKVYGNDIKIRAKAVAAAGSDARMNGCELPVIINSGSGNQGLTCSLPVIEYAKEFKVSEEKLYRALVLSNLVAIHEKTGIGTLSAYCGAVSAGAAAGAGVAYICGGDYNIIKHTIVNALATVSGIVCDGAKASCAAKIAASVEAGLLGYYMFLNGQEFKCGDGIVMKDIESTIHSVGILGKEGMKETNKEIIKLMIDNNK